jgi:hypothetical protein
MSMRSSPIVSAEVCVTKKEMPLLHIVGATNEYHERPSRSLQEEKKTQLSANVERNPALRERDPPSQQCPN